MSKRSNPVEAAPPFALKAIYLRQSKASMSDSFDPTIPGQKVTGTYRVAGGKVDVIELVPDVQPATKIQYCRFITNFEFHYLLEDGKKPHPEDGDKSVADISVEIAIDYLVTSPGMPDHDLLQKWAQTNVLLHAYPYWREFCQSTLARMSLPVVVLPLLNVQSSMSPPPTAK